MRSLKIAIIMMWSLAAVADQGIGPLCESGLPSEKPVETLNKDIVMTECKIELPIGERYTEAGCQIYKRCYEARQKVPDKNTNEILAEVAKKHAYAQVLKSNKQNSLLKYEALKAILENITLENSAERNALKLCDGQFTVKSSDDCAPSLMKEVADPEKIIEFRKNIQAKQGRQLKAFRQAIHTRLDAIEAIKVYSPSSYRNPFNDTSVADPLLDMFGNVPVGSKIVKPNEAYQTFAKEIENSKIITIRDEKTFKYILENANKILEDICSDDESEPSMNDICKKATALAKGEKDASNLCTPKGLNTLFENENTDDLDISYQRCISYEVLNFEKKKMICENILELHPTIDNSGGYTMQTATEQEAAKVSSNPPKSAAVNPYGSPEAFVGPMDQGSLPSKTGDLPPIEKKVTVDQEAKQAEVNGMPTAHTAAPVQNSNSSSYSNAYTGVDYGIPGTHPLATDQSGVPIPPPSTPSDSNSQAQQDQHQGQASAANPDVRAIQAKLDETQEKLDKLTAEVAATKAVAEKKKQQDEVEGLKKEIEKLKAEKASAVLAAALPAPQAAQHMSAPTMAPVPVRQEEYRVAAPAQKVSAAVKATAAAERSVPAGIGAASGLLVRQDIINMPSVDLTNTSSEDPAILKLAMSSVGGKAFPVQDKNKIIWTIVPLIKDGKVVSYTAIREKKIADKKEKTKEVSRMPASAKAAPVEPAKREIFLKDLNGLMKGKN